MSPEIIPTERTTLCINALTSHAVTLEEEALRYFTRTKLQQLSIWDEWKVGKKKHIDQFNF